VKYLKKKPSTSSKDAIALSYKEVALAFIDVKLEFDNTMFNSAAERSLNS
jgi:hypothetical protein